MISVSLRIHSPTRRADDVRCWNNEDIDAPIQLTAAPGGGAEPSAEQVELLGAMGFTSAQAKKALRETVCYSLHCSPV
jgi:hypothetical protein